MEIDRIFLDANILFSVAYGSVGLKTFWALQREGRCVLVCSRFVVEEARRNLDSAKQLEALETYVSQTTIAPEADPQIPCPIDLPQKDIPVFMAAMKSNCNYLITGDRTHFGRYFGQIIMGVKICTPRDYLDSL